MATRVNLRGVLVPMVLLIGALLVADCDGTSTPEPTFTPSEAVEVEEPGYEAQRIDPSAWATTDTSQPDTLLRLNDSNWHGLVGRRLVTTDLSGQAKIRGNSCSAAYVYQQSGLKLSACPKGGGTGTCATGTIALADCDLSVQTMPADVSIVGSWLSVSYLAEPQVTLVIVAEGAVRVTPVTELDFTLVDPQLLEFEVTTRALGEPIGVQVEGGQEAQLLYTASDQRLVELRERGELPTSRAWLGLDQLTPLRQVLTELDPNLDLWLEQIQMQAEQDGLDLEPSPVTLVSVVNGDPQPEVAIAWEVSDDGQQWTFFLNEDRTMIDGQPYTSEIVANVLDREGQERITGYAGIEIIDKFTLWVLLETPNPNLLMEIALIELPQ